MAGDAAMAALNLSRAFEERLLEAHTSGARRVPAVVVSGFLGSGKTSLVRSLLRSRANLRFALIMNELADADVDSALLGGAAANAAVGLPLLSVPNACACCTGAAALRAAVRQVLDASTVDSVDALLVETTGLADPGPLARALAEEGVELDCVVTVVDAEAAAAQLAGPAAATLHSQLRCADLIVLNKCDLVSLGTLSDTEDALARLAPARIMRCRHGAVPITALLDVHVAPPQHAEPSLTAGGYLSHEASRNDEVRFVMAAREGRSAKRARLTDEPDTSTSIAAPHVLELERISSVVWKREGGAPLCAAAFSAWLLRDVAPAKGLLRAKGQLFLSQRRMQRHVFHFSGARRVEAVEQQSWEGAPASSVVLIGTDRTALLALRDKLNSAAEQALGDDDHTGAAAAADAFAQLLASDARFDVQLVESDASHAKDRRGFVAFGLRGLPLKGVDGAVLNLSLMRRVNGAALQQLLFGVAAPQPDRMARLRIAFAGGEDVAAAHACVLQHAEAVLREALAHVGLCNC